MTDPNPVVAALLASGRRALAPIDPKDTAVSHADEPQPPMPAEGAPHAYVAVERTFSPHADRPEWDFKAVVIPAWNTKELEYWLIQDGHTLLPIGPDGDTGTRAIVEEVETLRDEVEDFQAACRSACEQRDAALEQLAAVRALATNWATQWGATNLLLASAGTPWQIEDGRELLAILDGKVARDGE